jgi:hypothetical protein
MWNRRVPSIVAEARIIAAAFLQAAGVVSVSPTSA